MKRTPENPTAFLWVLRALITAFLLGYLVSIYISVFISDWFPAGNRLEDLSALGLVLLFAAGYYLMWIRREGWSALLFILWFAALWIMDLRIGGERWEDAPVPGILLFILAVLLIVYRVGSRKKETTDPVE
jgi:hypothetical protein